MKWAKMHLRKKLRRIQPKQFPFLRRCFCVYVAIGSLLVSRCINFWWRYALKEKVRLNAYVRCTYTLPHSHSFTQCTKKTHTYTKTRKTPNLKHMEHAVKQTLRIFVRWTFLHQKLFGGKRFCDKAQRHYFMFMLVVFGFYSWDACLSLKLSGWMHR